MKVIKKMLKYTPPKKSIIAHLIPWLSLNLLIFTTLINLVSMIKVYTLVLFIIVWIFILIKSTKYAIKRYKNYNIDKHDK